MTEFATTVIIGHSRHKSVAEVIILRSGLFGSSLFFRNQNCSALLLPGPHTPLLVHNDAPQLYVSFALDDGESSGKAGNAAEQGPRRRATETPGAAQLPFELERRHCHEQQR